jgi:hypothetical protein
MDRCGKSRPIGIRSPDCPARSQSLYRLSYPAHSYVVFDVTFDRVIAEEQTEGRIMGEMWDRSGMRGRRKNMIVTVKLIALPMGIAWKW